MNPLLRLEVRGGCVRAWYCSASLFLALSIGELHAEDFTYTNIDGTITITGYTGPGGNVDIPSTIAGLPVTTIGAFSFSNCIRLKQVTIPESVVSVGNDAFYFCLGLTNVTMTASIISIGDRAFFSCWNLSGFTMPQQVASIGTSAFAFCYSLPTITIPASVTNIGAGAFTQCSGMTGINVDAYNSFYSSVDGVLFDKSQTVILRYPEPRAGRYKIPNTVRNIDGDAFTYCSGLSSVTIPGSVTNIGYFAFYRCDTLTSAYFEGNAPSSDEPFGDPNARDWATIYYLPGSTGWGPVTYDLPTALRQPLVQITAPSFGVGTNGFGFTVSWADGMTVLVEASTNLISHSWIPLATNTLSSGSSYFSDPQWGKYSQRLYRVRKP